jgi:6-pyruvoyl-tetrahydropterin synthase
MIGRTLTGVGCVLSCSHDPVNHELFGGAEHGHSYEIMVWFDNDKGPRDYRICQAAVETLRKQLDHKKLPPELSTGEAIAAYFAILQNVVQVDVNRPLERIFARWAA